MGGSAGWVIEDPPEVWEDPLAGLEDPPEIWEDPLAGLEDPPEIWEDPLSSCENPRRLGRYCEDTFTLRRSSLTLRGSV